MAAATAPVAPLTGLPEQFAYLDCIGAGTVNVAAVVVVVVVVEFGIDDVLFMFTVTAANVVFTVSQSIRTKVMAMTAISHKHRNQSISLWANVLGFTLIFLSIRSKKKKRCSNHFSNAKFSTLTTHAIHTLRTFAS